MNDSLKWGFRQLTRNHREGSFQTQHQRRWMLNLIAKDLRKLGYRNLKPKNVKTRHVQRLVNEWKASQISPGTIKNRLSCLRWAMRKCGRANAIPKDNASLGVERRSYLPEQSKARYLDWKTLESIRHPEIRVSLMLQSAFGLRREESLKFRPAVADQESHIWLQGSWCKGGRPRAVPIRTNHQRTVLLEAHRIAGRKSMIPDDLTYRNHLNRFSYETRRIGLKGVHCLRHAYAQDRFRELAGFPCPLAGGPVRSAMSYDQLERDREARLTLAEELGHGRLSVTNQYLGR